MCSSLLHTIQSVLCATGQCLCSEPAQSLSLGTNLVEVHQQLSTKAGGPDLPLEPERDLGAGSGEELVKNQNIITVNHLLAPCKR